MRNLSHAISLAAEAHQNQTDWQGEPYIFHPLRVMYAVRRAGYSEQHQIAAVLHDLLEDTYANPSYSLPRFGKEVTAAVHALTRRYEPLPGSDHVFDEYGSRRWGKPLETYQEYFQRCVENPMARVVKYYDLLDNMNPRRYSKEAPYERYLQCLQWYADRRAGARAPRPPRQ